MGFSWGDAINLASTGYDIYSGIESMNTAEDMYDIAAGSAAVQDKIANGQWEIAEPVLQQQAAVATDDAANYLATSEDRQAIYKQQLGLQAQDLSIYEQYAPEMQSSYYANMQGDLDAYGSTQDVRDDILSAQYANSLAAQNNYTARQDIEQQNWLADQENVNATRDLNASGIAYNQGLLESRNADLAMYNDNKGIIQDFYDASSQGLDIGEQVQLAKNDVANAFAGQELGTRMSMARMGVDPTSGRYADQDRTNATSRALAVSGAGTNARLNAEKENYSRLSNATNVLKGLSPAGYSTSGGSNLSAPSNSVSVQNSGLGSYTAPSTSTTKLSGLSASNSALSGLSSSASTTGQLASAASNAAGSSFASAGSGLASWQKNSTSSDWLNSSIF